MTRSFQIIGQGLTRCHPHMLELIHSLQGEGDASHIRTFRNQLGKVIGHGVSNFAYSIGRGLESMVQTRFRSSKAHKNGAKLLEYHEKQLLRLSSNFAVTADLCFTLGGKLKFEELLMGRLADALGGIYLGYATLHYYHRHKGIEGLEAVTEHAMLRLEHEAQQALIDASNNFPGPLGPVASIMMKTACLSVAGVTLGEYPKPSDRLTKEVANLITTPSEIRNMFQENIYMAPEDQVHQISDLIRAVPICVEADKIASLVRREKREPTNDESDVLAQADALRDALIQVDVFEHATFEEAQKGYTRPALKGTADRLSSLERKSFLVAA